MSVIEFSEDFQTRPELIWLKYLKLSESGASFFNSNIIGITEVRSYEAVPILTVRSCETVPILVWN